MDILGSSLWRLLRWLPGFVLKIIFKKHWMAENIYIDIKPRGESVRISQPDQPSVTMYLVIRNSSHFSVTIDRLLLDFYYGCKMSSPNHFERIRLKPGEEKDLFVTGDIGHDQIQSLPFQYHHNSSNCRLELFAECESKLHNFSIRRTLESIKPEILNEHLLVDPKVEVETVSS